MDLLAFKDDYSRTFGSHSLKAGALYSFNRKNEAAFIGRRTRPRSSASRPASAARPDHRQRRGRSAASGHDLRLLREVCHPVRAATLAGPGGLRVRLVEGPPPSHDRRRLAGLLPGQPLRDERRDHELRSGGVRSGSRCRPCNGLLQVPEKDPCRAAGFQGGAPGPNRALVKNRVVVAPRLGAAWTSSAMARRRSGAASDSSSSGRASAASLALSGNPPFAGFRTGIRALDTNVEPCEGCLSPFAGSPPGDAKSRGSCPTIGSGA